MFCISTHTLCTHAVRDQINQLPASSAVFRLRVQLPMLNTASVPRRLQYGRLYCRQRFRFLRPVQLAPSEFSTEVQRTDYTSVLAVTVNFAGTLAPTSWHRAPWHKLATAAAAPDT